MFGFGAAEEPGLAADDVRLVPLPATAEPPAEFLTGLVSQLHPEVTAIKRPKVVAIFTTATTKVKIEDVEFIVMGLILNNGL
jgi:hypothetical protein